MVIRNVTGILCISAVGIEYVEGSPGVNQDQMVNLAIGIEITRTPG